MDGLRYDPKTLVITGHCEHLPIYLIRNADPNAAITIQKNGFLITATSEPKMLEIVLIIHKSMNTSFSLPDPYDSPARGEASGCWDQV
jgi:hypothetical protein